VLFGALHCLLLSFACSRSLYTFFYAIIHDTVSYSIRTRLCEVGRSVDVEADDVEFGNPVCVHRVGLVLAKVSQCWVRCELRLMPMTVFLVVEAGFVPNEGFCTVRSTWS